MKKSFFYTVALLLAGTVMTACSGGDDVTSDVTPVPQPSSEAGVVELVGTLGSKGSLTRTIADDGVGSWEIGDKFAIYYATADGHSTAVATVSSINANGSANFRASLYYPKTGSSDVTLVYPASAHDGKGGFKTDALMKQEGTLEYINANGLDFESAKTTLNVVDTKATLNSDVTMQPQVCLYTLQLRKDNYNDLEPAKLLEINDGTHNYTIIPTSAATSFTVALLPTSNADFTFRAITNESGPGHIYIKQIGVTLDNCTSANVGDVFDEDGYIYTVSAESGATYIKSSSSITLEIGKFYSQRLIITKTKMPVGMIAYVGNHGTVDDSSTDSQTGFRGLAIAMIDTDKNTTTRESWPRQYGDSYYEVSWCSQYTDSCTKIACDNATDICSRKDGIRMTDSLIKHASHTHYPAMAAHNYNMHYYGDYYSTNSGWFHSSSNKKHPTGTSEWFLPSVGQWQLIVRGITTAKGEPYTDLITKQISDGNIKGNLNYVLSKAGAKSFLNSGCYWLSSESSKGYAWAIAADSYAFSHEKGFEARVCAVLAF